MTIDLTKPVQTRDGRAARVLVTNLSNPQHPVAAAVMTDGIETTYGYTLDGHLVPETGGSDPLDLLPAPAVDVQWVNFYGSQNELFATSDAAQTYAGPSRLALFKITTTDGMVTSVQLAS